jgi:hypothetical protein
MKKTTSKLTITIAALGLFAMTGASALAGSGFKRITSESELNQLVVGKKMFLDKNYLTIKKNGSLSGEFGGKTLKGNWAWRDGYWCRTLLTHSKDTDCQVFEIEGNQLRGTRERGNGKSFVYVIK